MTSSAAQSGAGRKKVPASSRDGSSRAGSSRAGSSPDASSEGTVDGKPDGGTAQAGTPPEGTADSANLATGAEKRAVIARLMLGSAVMLFLELALIRWLGSNVVHLSYFSNFVLLGSFLGIGIGFLISRRSWSILPVAPILLAALVLFVLLFPVQIKDQVGASIIYFTSLDTSGPPAWLVLPIIFIVVAVILAGPAEVVGRCFGRLRPLTSYRYDLVGSLIGITLFTGVSFLRAPSYVWGLLVTAGFVLLIGGWKRILTAVVGVGMIVALLLESLAPGISWSPYYKVKTEDWVFNNVNVVEHLGQRHSAPADGARRLEADLRRAAVRQAVRAHPEQPAGQRADRRRGLRLRRRDRTVQGRQAHRRRRHRPADRADRRGAQPRPCLSGPAGDRAHQRRPGVPRDHRQQVRPDPVRAARLVGAGERCLADPARVASCSPRRRSSRRRITSSPTAPSRCTTTTATTG